MDLVQGHSPWPLLVLSLRLLPALWWKWWKSHTTPWVFTTMWAMTGEQWCTNTFGLKTEFDLECSIRRFSITSHWLRHRNIKRETMILVACSCVWEFHLQSRVWEASKLIDYMVFPFWVMGILQWWSMSSNREKTQLGVPLPLCIKCVIGVIALVTWNPWFTAKLGILYSQQIMLCAFR